MGGSLGSLGKILAPIAGGALGAAGGAGLGDLFGIGAGAIPYAADIGGALGGAAGSALIGGSPVADILGAVGGAATGPGIDNFLGIPGFFGNSSFGGGILDLFGGGANTGAIGGGGSGNLGTGAGTPNPAGVNAAASDPVGALSAGSPTSAAGGILPFLQKNSNWLLPAVGLGAAALKGDQVPQEGNLTGLAQQAGQVGQLANSLQTGKLPAGAQQMAEQQLESDKTSIQSQYASMGLSNSPMMQQDLQKAQARYDATLYQMASQATTTGLNALGISSGIYNQIANYQLSQDQALQNAIASFAGAASGGGNAQQLLANRGYNPIPGYQPVQ